MPATQRQNLLAQTGRKGLYYVNSVTYLYCLNVCVCLHWVSQLPASIYVAIATHFEKLNVVLYMGGSKGQSATTLFSIK